VKYYQEHIKRFEAMLPELPEEAERVVIPLSWGDTFTSYGGIKEAWESLGVLSDYVHSDGWRRNKGLCKKVALAEYSSVKRQVLGMGLPDRVERVEVRIGGAKLSCLRGQKEVKALIARLKKGKAVKPWKSPGKVRGSSWQELAEQLLLDGDEYGAYCLHRDKGTPYFVQTALGPRLLCSAAQWAHDYRFVVGKFMHPRKATPLWGVVHKEAGRTLAEPFPSRADMLIEVDGMRVLHATRWEGVLASVSLPEGELPLEEQFVARFDV
jgi:hypothetical protein